MAHFVMRGPDALPFVQWVVTNDAARLAPGSALYSPICRGTGTFVDDCTVIRRGDDEYLLSTGLDSTYGWLCANRANFALTLEDHSRRLVVIAVQGPRSPQILDALGLTRTLVRVLLAEFPAVQEVHVQWRSRAPSAPRGRCARWRQRGLA